MEATSGRGPGPIPIGGPDGRRRPRRAWRVLAWLLLVAAAGKFCVRGPLRAPGSSTDWALYYTATRAWLWGANPYDADDLWAVAMRSGGAPGALLENSITPPVVFVPLAPLAMLPWRAAMWAWLGVNLLLTAGMCAGLVRLAGLAARDVRAVLLVGLVLALAPLTTGLKHGQLAGVCVALLVGAAWAQRAGRATTAGVLLGLAGLFKPQVAAAFGLYWLGRRRWRGVAAAGLVVAAAAALAVGRLEAAGVPWLAQWRSNVAECFRGGACDYAVPVQAHIFIQLQHPLYAIFGSRAVATWGGWAVTLALGAAGLAAWRRLGPAPGREPAALALLAVLCLLPVYHVFYDATVLVFPLAWAVGALATPLWRWAVAAIGLTVPFWVSGAAALYRLGEFGGVPWRWVDSWWWPTLLLPHQSYALAVLAAVLVGALWRAGAVAGGQAS